MTFRAAVAGPRVCQRSTVSRAVADAPSAVRASMTSGPAAATLKSRSRKFVVFGGAGPARVRRPVRCRRCPCRRRRARRPRPASRMLRPVMSLPVDEDRQASRRLGPVRRRLDANVDPLPGREHAAVGRHDPNPRRRRRRQDSQTHAQRSSNSRESHGL